ncbi:MAG TPA: tetratricopeptide repeat protein [Pyrinomonadaceae bacterium]|nr:tetratricopeptide repeat protein [Pyrinomonadaceae bacterium]
MREQNHSIYEFGPFRLDAGRRLLLKDGEPVKLFPKEFDTLLALVERSGEELDKDELMRRVWGETVVEEGNLAKNISSLRRALGESPSQHQYIVTVPGQGYRFVAGVRAPAFNEVLLHERTRAELTVEEDHSPAATEEVKVKLIASPDKASSRGFLIPVACTLLVILVGAGYFFGARRTEQHTPPGTDAPPARIKTIAVLPFKPLVAESRDESLELGMADTLITRLSNVREITVRPMSAVRKYVALDQDAMDAGREQRVDAVLDGSIQKVGGEVRVTARLLRVADGAQIWAEKFDREFTNIFVVQDSISERVAEALALKLTGEERQLLTKRYTEDTEAYHLYLIGRNYWNGRTEESISKSIDYFNKAIEKDPKYALAYAGLADAYSMLAFHSELAPKVAFPKAKDAVTEALKRDDKLAEGHASLASILSHYDWDQAGAEKEFKRAIELNPNYPTAHHWYSLHLAMMGRFDQAISEAKLARELDPLSPVVNSDLGQILRWAGRHDEAIEQLRATIEMHPDFPYAHFLLGLAYLQKGNRGEAVAELNKSRELFGGRSEEFGALGYIYAVSGQRDEALKILAEVNRVSKRKYVSPFVSAGIYMGLGDRERALKQLEKAYEVRDWHIGLLKVEPAFNSYRSDPRFEDLLRRTGLAP